MTLTETLQLKERFLQFDDLRALDYCEKRWKEAGEPTERWQVINFLEKMLCELKNQGGYPKVLLLRKKEIQRRTFTLPELGQESEQAECSCYGGWLLYWQALPLSKRRSAQRAIPKMGNGHMMLREEIRRRLLEERGICPKECCDKCGQILGAVRFMRRGENGVWCSPQCRGDVRSRKERIKN